MNELDHDHAFSGLSPADTLTGGGILAGALQGRRRPEGERLPL